MRQKRWWGLAALCASSALAFYVSAPRPVPASTGDGAAAMAQYSPSVDTLGPQRFVTVWADERASGYEADIWGTVVDVIGGKVTPVRNNVALTSSRTNKQKPGIACGPNSCLVTWSEDQTIVGVRVDPDLHLLDATPLIIEACTNDCFNPSAAWDGTSWLTAFIENDVKTRRVPASGPVISLGEDLGPSQYGTFPAVATNGALTLVAFANANGDLVWATYAAGAIAANPTAFPSITPNHPITRLNIAARADAGFFIAWREQAPVRDTLQGIALDSSGHAPSTGAPRTLIDATEGDTIPPLVVTPSTAIVTYYDSNDGEVYDNTVNLTTLALGVPKDVSLPGFGYSAALSAATLPTGEQVIAHSTARVNDEVELVAIDTSIHLLDAGPSSAYAQVDARAVWRADHFTLVTFEEGAFERRAYAHTLDAVGTVSLSQTLAVNDSSSYLPALASDGDGGAVLAWANYDTLTLSALGGTTVQSALNEAQIPGVLGFFTLGLNTVGSRIFGALGAVTNATCLVDIPSATAPAVTWKSACAPLNIFEVATAASNAHQWVAYTLNTGELDFVKLPLAPAALDAGALIDDAVQVFSSSTSYPHVPAMASDGTNVLLVWWYFDYSFERVGAALIGPTGSFTVLPDLSRRAVTQSSNRRNVKPIVAWDGVRYEVAYSAPGSGGGWDAFVRPVDPDGTLQPEQVVAVTGVDQSVEALAASTPGRVLAVTRAYDSSVGAMRMSTRVLAAVPPGYPCFAANECLSGTCNLIGLCSGAALDGGYDAGFDAGIPDAGFADAGTPDAGRVDAGTDAGQGTQTFAAGCGCHSSEAPLVVLLFWLCVPARRSRRRSRWCESSTLALRIGRSQK